MITTQASIFERQTLRGLIVTDDPIKYCDRKGEIILKVRGIRHGSRFTNLFIFMNKNNVRGKCST